MNALTSTQFESLLAAADMKPRFKRDLKFTASTEGMDDAAWSETELFPVWNKSKNGGVLLLQPDDDIYAIPFEATVSKADVTGKSRSVICDFCYTWRSGREGGFVTFYPDRSSDNSLSLLCCMELGCSAHVRTKTKAALKSRTQLRENMTNDDRIERLRQKLREFIARINNKN